MAYPQDAGLSSLMANYGNISQGMNPGQQPSFGGNPYFPGMPGMNQSQVPSYQPQDWGGFAPGQLSSQYGQSTYGTNNGMVNYGYGQQPVIDYAKQLADQQAAAKAAADKAATTPSSVAQNVDTAPSLTGGRSGSDPTGGSSYNSTSPLGSSINGDIGYNLLNAYGSIPFLPGSTFASILANSMFPGQMDQASQKAAAALADAKAGYAQGTMFGAPPSNPNTFGGAGYGTAPGFVTSATGAGIAANPMGVDPQQAQAAMAGMAAPAQNNIGVNGYGSESGPAGDGGRAASEGGGEGHDAVGGYYANGQFNYHPQYANGGIIALMRNMYG